QLIRRRRRHFLRALINPYKNQIAPGRGLPPSIAQPVLEGLLAIPRKREKRNFRKELPAREHDCPDRANACECEIAMAREPVHSKILENCTGTANPKGGVGRARSSRESGAYQCRERGTLPTTNLMPVWLGLCSRHACRYRFPRWKLNFFAPLAAFH